MPRLPRKWKDPSKPKPPPSAFIIYSNDHRAALAAECPHLQFGDVARELSKRWGALSPEEKMPYEARAAELRAKFQLEMQSYVPAPVPRRAEAPLIDPLKPKRPSPAFMFFSNANRALVKAEVPGLDFGGIARELTRRWAELPDADKKPFLDLADQDKRRFQMEMKAYVPPPPKEVVMKARKSVKQLEPRKPSPPYIIFTKVMRPKLKAEHPAASLGDLATLLSEQWRALSYADRQPYIDLSKSDKARYDSEMVVYLNDIAAASSLPSSITLDRSKIGQLFDTAINPRVVRRYHFDSESDGEDGEEDVVDRIDDGEEGDEGGDDGLDEEQFYTTSGFSGEEVTV